MTTLTAHDEQLVNSTTLNDQSAPAIVKLANGYVVVWQSLQTPAGYADQHFPAGTDIYMQRYSDAGVALGSEVLVNSVTFNDQTAPVAVALADGGFVIAWASAREQAVVNYDDGVYLQRFDSAGAPVGGETKVNDFYYLNQDRPSIAALSDGGFVVTWTSDVQSPHPPGIYAKHFGADGIATGADLRIDTTSSGSHASSAAIGLADGGYVIVWDGNGDIHAQQFDAAGVAKAAPSQVNTTSADLQFAPAATALADGGWVVTWQSQGQDGSESGIYLQRYSASGAAAGDELQVNSTTAGNQAAPSVTALADGGFLVAWESAAQDGSGSGVYAQQYDASGHAVGTQTQVNSTTAGDQSAAAVAAAGDGGFIAAWTSAVQDGSGSGVYARTFSSDQVPPQGGPAQDTYVHGTAGLDTALIASDTAGILAYSLAGGVLSITTAHGTQHLDNVERVQLSDALFALDTQGPSGAAAAGHVWEAAALWWAGFGAAPDRSALSQWTAQADHSPGMPELGQQMIDFYAPGISSSDLVAHLYQNVVGHAADADTVQALADQVGVGRPFATEGDLFAFAASLALNTDHMAGLVGSVQQLDAAWF